MCTSEARAQQRSPSLLPPFRKKLVALSSVKAIDLLLSTDHHQSSMLSNLPANWSTFAHVNLHVISVVWLVSYQIFLLSQNYLNNFWKKLVLNQAQLRKTSRKHSSLV